jgi:hypothetical protein
MALDVTDLLVATVALNEELMDIDLGGSRYNSPDLTGDLVVVSAYEYRDRRVPWSDLPDGTTVTARVEGAVPSGVSMTVSVLDLNTNAATPDPTPFTTSLMTLHTFTITKPIDGLDHDYRLQATVTGGSGVGVTFLGALRTVLP